MNSWPFPHEPKIVKAGACVSSTAPFRDTEESPRRFCEVQLAGTSISFQVQARFRYLQIYMQNIEISGHPKGSYLKLGWRHNGFVAFFLVGDEGNFTCHTTAP